MAIFRNDSKIATTINNYVRIHYKPLLLQLSIISIGITCWFIELGLFYLFNEADFTWFTTWGGLISILFFFVYFVEFTFIIANISAFFFWICAKKMGGKGSFSETCTALLWTALYTFVPFQFFYFLIMIKKLGLLVHNLSFLGVIASIIYGIVAMGGKLSKVHGISSDSGTNAFLLGALLQAPLLYLLISLSITHMRTIFIITIPISAQVITTAAIITIGLNILKKLGKTRPYKF